MSTILNKKNQLSNEDIDQEHKCMILSIPANLIGEIISFILLPQTIFNFHLLNHQMNDIFSSNDNESIYSIALKVFFNPLLSINYCYSSTISPKDLFKSLLKNFLSKTTKLRYTKNNSNSLTISKSFAGNGAIGKFLSNSEKFFFIKDNFESSILKQCPCCLSDILFDEHELIINNEDTCCDCCRSYSTKNDRKGIHSCKFNCMKCRFSIEININITGKCQCYEHSEENSDGGDDEEIPPLIMDSSVATIFDLHPQMVRIQMLRIIDDLNNVNELVICPVCTSDICTKCLDQCFLCQEVDSIHIII